MTAMSVLTWKAGKVFPLTRGEPRLEAGEFDPSQHEALLRSAPERYVEMVRNVTAFGIYRMDRDGRIQVWEINTNPQIMRAPQFYPEGIRPFHQAFAERYLAAMQSIDSGGEESTDAGWPDLASALMTGGEHRSRS